jgi:hypothetical protein
MFPYMIKMSPDMIVMFPDMMLPDMIKIFPDMINNVSGYDLKDSEYRKDSGYGKIHSRYDNT